MPSASGPVNAVRMLFSESTVNAVRFWPPKINDKGAKLEYAINEISDHNQEHEAAKRGSAAPEGKKRPHLNFGCPDSSRTYGILGVPWSEVARTCSFADNCTLSRSVLGFHCHLENSRNLVAMTKEILSRGDRHGRVEL